MLNNLATIVQNFVSKFWKLTELLIIKFLLTILDFVSLEIDIHTV